MIDHTELRYLRRCVELATQALDAGDEPFGSVLVDANGAVRAEDRNRVAQGDRTRHPEFALARWSASNMLVEERASATVYTSGEHCPMCAAAHAWVGLGRIVYVASSEQLAAWLDELGVPPPPVQTLPVQDVAPGIVVDGPVASLAEQVHDLHRRYHSRVRRAPRMGSTAAHRSREGRSVDVDAQLRRSPLGDGDVATRLPAQDLQRAKRFYADKLGLEPIEERPGGLRYRCGNGFFSLFESTGAPSGQHTQMAWEVDDLDAVVETLQDRGVVFETVDVAGLRTADGIAEVEGNYPSAVGVGERAAWFRDSEGNLLGIGQPTRSAG